MQQAHAGNSDIDRVAERLDRVVAAKHLLDHAFYRAWAEGSLTTGDLARYAGQYWRQVEAFPGYLERLAGTLPEGSAARAAVEENLADERDGDHTGLWLRFARAVGAAPDELAQTPPNAATVRCVEAFRDGVDRSPLFALGMLYGYESQTPAVASTKRAGLADFYGIEGDGSEYFRLHATLDIEHARGIASAIAELASGDLDLAEAEAGARAGAAAVWGLLDGVTPTP